MYYFSGKRFYAVFFWRELFIVAFLFIFLLGSRDLHGNIKMKFIVMNPSNSEDRKIPVKYYLPGEIKPNDVIEAENLLIEYDDEMAKYYVYTDIKLGPKESRTFEIDLKDVWHINEQELTRMSDYAQFLAFELIGERDGKTAQILNRAIQQRIALIRNSRGADFSINKRISRYRKNAKRLVLVQNDLNLLKILSEAE